MQARQILKEIQSKGFNDSDVHRMLKERGISYATASINRLRNGKHSQCHERHYIALYNLLKSLDGKKTKK
jgi:hypothetical protein